MEALKVKTMVAFEFDRLFSHSIIHTMFGKEKKLRREKEVRERMRREKYVRNIVDLRGCLV
jgi:hypothetical protein